MRRRGNPHRALPQRHLQPADGSAGTLDQLAAADVPVKLTPELPGVWKWLGTQTLSFEYRSEDLNRFPMATAYTAEVPAGTTSAVGGVLAETVTWTFRTPAPQVVHQTYPSSSPQPRDPLLFVAFDQAIDPAPCWRRSARHGKGGRSFPLRLATAAEVAADARRSPTLLSLSTLAAGSPSARERLPGRHHRDHQHRAGHALRRRAADERSGAVVQLPDLRPLRVVDSRCAGAAHSVRPASPSRALQQPARPQRSDNSSGDRRAGDSGDDVAATTTRWRSGATAGRTTYKVTLSGAVQDIFGQTLGQDQRFTFTTGQRAAF
jgi:hypothetical protein